MIQRTRTHTIKRLRGHSETVGASLASPSRSLSTLSSHQVDPPDKSEEEEKGKHHLGARSEHV